MAARGFSDSLSIRKSALLSAILIASSVCQASPQIRPFAIQDPTTLSNAMEIPQEELEYLKTLPGPCNFLKILGVQNVHPSSARFKSVPVLGKRLIQEKESAEFKHEGVSQTTDVAEKQEAAVPGVNLPVVKRPSIKTASNKSLRKLDRLETAQIEFSDHDDTPMIFDIPLTYNSRVQKWIQYFQTNGRTWFRTWLERSTKFLPLIQYELNQAGLPQDLAYVAMVESGFSTSAVSHASAVGLWQFIAPTGNQYGLQTKWWLDERRDHYKSTRAAVAYIRDLYKIFSSWYLVAASYNMGETRLKKLVARHRTNNFWTLADLGVLPDETRDYVPKILAAMLIAKAPALYGFRDLEYQLPVAFEYFSVPGGTDLTKLAGHLGVREKHLRDLNPELTRAYVPKEVAQHRIRIPKGSMLAVSQFVRSQLHADNRTR